MPDQYSVSCDYGGIGNFQEGDTACLLCPHEIECSHEAELSQLAAIQRRRGGSAWRYPNRSTSGGGRIATTGTSVSSPMARARSRRPLPIKGESALSRMVKNAGASMLSAGFHELGDFWDVHDFAPTVDGQVVHVKKEEKG